MTKLPTDPSVENGTTSGSSSSGRTAAELGVPDTLPVTWCPKCQADVKPMGKGQCPRCGRVLKHSFMARKKPVNVLVRDQHLRKLVADYQPSTTMATATCRHLAGILEQLDVMRPGSAEYQRLVQLSQQLATRLEETRPPKQVDRITEVHRVIVWPHGELPEPAPTAGLQAEGVSKPDAPNPVPGAASPVGPAPEPGCPYCRRECVGPDHPAFAVLHWSDPEEIKRRDAEATAVMLKTMRHGSGITQW